jgi:hypothetical protein
MLSSSPHSTFRPELEALEQRTQPSLFGVGLFLLNNNITTALANETSLVTQLQTAQQQLTTDINNAASTTTIENDYSKAASLFGQVASANTQLGGLLSLEQMLIFAALGSGDSFDQQIAGFLFFGLNGLQTKLSSNLTTATNTVNMTEPLGNPSIGQGAIT